MVGDGKKTEHGAALSELRRLRQWVCWEYGKRRPNGRWEKVPVNPATGGRARTTRPDTWGDYAQAVAAAEERGYDGVGFVFTPDDPYTGIDLDDCVRDGEIAPWADEIVRAVGSYVEVSPSGTGLKIWLKGAKPGSHCVAGNIEIYDADHYFTFTRRHYGANHAIESRQEALDDLYRRLFPPKERATEGASMTSGGFGGSDEGLLEKARGSASLGGRFTRLYDRGDWSGFRSQSEADMLLCGTLAFWTGRDQERMRRLFLRSALALTLDRKQDPDAYLARTISRAAKNCRKVYEPNHAREAMR